jgi:hypothetical protein
VKAVLLFAALGLASILGSAKVFGSSRIPGLRLLARTGILFLLLGAVVGYNGLDLFDEDSFHKLGPLVIIGLGWLGFFFGTNLELRTMRKFPARLYLGAVGQAVVTFIVVFACFAVACEHFGVPSPDRWLVTTILAATAAGTAPASLFMLGSERAVRGSSFETLRFFSTVDDVPGLLALGILFSFAPGLYQAPISSPVFWFCLQIVLGVVFAFLLRALKLKNLDEPAGDLVVFGIIGMCSGMCLYLHLSPLFVCAITGMVVVNISEHSEGIYERVSRREHAFYVLFLLLSGCLWKTGAQAFWVLLGLYLLSRLLGKLVGTFAVAQALPKEYGLGRHAGLGLISQGGLAVAMVVSYRWAFETHLVDWAVGLVLSAVVVHELAAPWVELRLLHGKEAS